MNITFSIDISGGKYTIQQLSDGTCRILRHGEPWLKDSWSGVNCMMAMAYEIEELREKLHQIGA